MGGTLSTAATSVNRSDTTFLSPRGQRSPSFSYLSGPPTPAQLNAAGLSGTRSTNTAEHTVIEMGDLSERVQVHPEEIDFTQASSAESIRETLTNAHTLYLATEKERPIDHDAALEFVKAQQAQRALPEDQQNWEPVTQKYLAMFRIGAVEKKKMEDGWEKAGFFYALSTHPMSFAASIPAVMTLSKSTGEMQKHLLHYAKINFGIQMGVSLATPFFNAATQIAMVSRQELARDGYSNRCKEMSAPTYPKITEDLKACTAEMEADIATLEQLEKTWQERGTPLTSELVAINAAMAKSSASLEKFAKLIGKREARHDVINLNYVGQFNQGLNRVLKQWLNIGSTILGHTTGNPHYAAMMQVSTTVLSAVLHQFVAAPRDEVSKQQKTLEATARATNLNKPESRNKRVEELTVDDLALDGLNTQIRGPIGVALAQVDEVLDIQIKFAEQAIADLHGMNPADWRKLVALEAKETPDEDEQTQLASLREKRQEVAPDNAVKVTKLTDTLMALRTDRNHLKNGEWLEMSKEVQELTANAVDGQHRWSTAFKAAWARVRLPSEFIPQLAQRMGSSWQMIFAGSNMPLIVSAILRLEKAKATESGDEFVFPDWARYGIYAALGILGTVNALAAGASVNNKIALRNQLRKEAENNPGLSRVGFVPSTVGSALKAIWQAMWAVPSAVVERLTVDNANSRAEAIAGQLRGRMETMGSTINPSSSGASS
jgi:hypothetical protein